MDTKLADHCEKNNPHSVQLINDILEAVFYSLPILLGVAIEKASRKTFKGFGDHLQFRKISATTKEKIYLKRWENLDYVIYDNLIRPYFYGDDKRNEIKSKIAKHME